MSEKNNQLKVLDTGIKRAPTSLGSEEYEIIEALFSAGLNRDEVIKKLRFDRVYYYRRLAVDIRLQHAEKTGNKQFKETLGPDLANSIKKSLTGHKVALKKTIFEYVDELDKEGNPTGKTRKRKVGYTVEEKYSPSSSAVITTLMKVIAPSLSSGEVLLDDETNIEKLSDEQMNHLLEIGKIINNVDNKVVTQIEEGDELGF